MIIAMETDRRFGLANQLETTVTQAGLSRSMMTVNVTRIGQNADGHPLLESLT